LRARCSEAEERHGLRARGAIVADHLHADAAGDPRHFPADPAEPDEAERLAVELHAFERIPHAPSHRPIHARQIAAAGEYQRHRVLGDRSVAVALDGVHFDAEPVQRRDVHVARCAGAQKDDVLEPAALGHHLGRHIGVVVEANIVAGEQPRQVGGSKWIAVDRDRRVVGTLHAGKHRRQLVVAVDEDRFHGRPVPSSFADI